MIIVITGGLLDTLLFVRQLLGLLIPWANSGKYYIIKLEKINTKSKLEIPKRKC